MKVIHTNQVTEAIQTLCNQYPIGKERWKALKGIRWALQATNGEYAALNGLRVVLTADQSKAQVFDGRDNEQQKALFYSAILKAQVQPTLISAAI